MLKKLIIGVSATLVVALAVAGWEAYQTYQGISNIVDTHATRLPPCPKGKRPLFRPGAHIHHLTPTLAPPATSVAKPTGTPQETLATPTPSAPPPCEYRPDGPLPTLGGTKRVNILLLGSDNDKKGIPLLSQTMMVVTIDPVHKKVAILSIPRDFWLPIAQISDPTNPYSYHKIDEAMSFGASDSGSSDPTKRFLAGVSLARATVEDDFGIKIDYYAWVGLNGFIKVIDTLGGVVIDAQHPIVDDSYPFDITGNNPFAETRVYIPAGPQYMDGPTGLEYVRSRHADLVGDFGRGARQEQMLLGIRRKADHLGILDFGTIKNLVDALQGYVKSDVGTGQLLPMYDFARKLSAPGIKRLVLSPPKYSSEGTAFDGASIVNPNWANIRPVIKRMFAPIGRRGSGHPHKPPKQLTRGQAIALFTRVAGATPPAVALPPRKRPPHAVSGRIFFDQSGNIHSYNGKSFYQITHSAAISDESLTPNAKLLVYARRPTEVFSDIFLRDRKHHQTVRLTHNKANDVIVGDNVWAFHPAISPDGSTIVYASDAYKLTYNATGFIDLALYRYDVATGASTQITTPAPGAGGDADPRFDPADPTKIIYTRYYYLPNSSAASRLMLLDLNTGASQPLTPFWKRISQPAWQANGHHVAYIQATVDGTTLYEAPYFGGKLWTKRARKVAAGMVSEPAFSPDNRHMVFYKLVGNNFEMWEVNLKNGWPHGRPFELFTAPGLIASSPIVWTR